MLYKIISLLVFLIIGNIGIFVRLKLFHNYTGRQYVITTFLLNLGMIALWILYITKIL